MWRSWLNHWLSAETICRRNGVVVRFLTTSFSTRSGTRDNAASGAAEPDRLNGARKPAAFR